MGTSARTSAVPALTVAMPAYNAGRFVREALDSVLRQEGVDLEVVVVDDGSQDDTAGVVSRMNDPRVRLERNEQRRGIAACHNRILAGTDRPFVAHVDADDQIVPGALAKMVGALEAHPEAALAHCNFYDTDALGRQEECRNEARREIFATLRPPDVDHRTGLRWNASFTNALRTYRRSALEELGGFDESLPFGVDYDMALRILEKWEITLVPEFLYLRRVHDTNTTESLRFKFLRLWWCKYRIRRSLLVRGKITYWKDANFDLFQALARQTRRTWGTRSSVVSPRRTDTRDPRELPAGSPPTAGR